jgi:hypothetical protein
MNRLTWLALSSVLALSACKKQEAEPEQTQEPAPTPAAELSEAAIDQADLPVKEDFEEEAVKNIDEDNLESQLDALEREIAADKE